MTDRPALTREINMTITQDDVERELRTIIATDGADSVYERPEFIRAQSGKVILNGGSCFYAHRDPQGDAITEGCIVGRWLTRFHAVDITRLVGHLSDARELIEDDGILGEEPVEWGAVRLLRQVQVHQDNRVPWGQALEEALIEVAQGRDEVANRELDPEYESDEYDEDGPDPDDRAQDDQDGYNDPDPTPGD